jgi:hypothetical protein
VRSRTKYFRRRRVRKPLRQETCPNQTIQAFSYIEEAGKSGSSLEEKHAFTLLSYELWRSNLNEEKEASSTAFLTSIYICKHDDDLKRV